MGLRRLCQICSETLGSVSPSIEWTTIISKLSWKLVEKAFVEKATAGLRSKVGRLYI